MIEVLIVTAIVAVLAVTAVNYYGNASEEASLAVTRHNLQVIREAIARYFKDRLKYPTDLDALQGPYLGQTPEAMIRSSLGHSNWSFLIEVPSDATPGVNAFTAVDFTEIYYDPSGSKDRQFRKIKIKIDGKLMPW